MLRIKQNAPLRGGDSALYHFGILQNPSLGKVACWRSRMTEGFSFSKKMVSN